MRRIGGSSRILSLLTLGAGGLGIALIGVIAVAPEATASHLGTLEERRAQREAERAARRAEREARQEADTSEPTCVCRTTLAFSRPDLQWRSGGLTFIPRVDVDVRVRGQEAPDWSADLAYSGAASFTSEDVPVPGSVNFNGTRHLAGGACDDNRYRFSGLALEPVTLTGLVRSLVGHDQELDGIIRMQAEVTGCALDAESRQFGFSVSELGNLKLLGWRSAR